MKCFALILILSTSASALQWTMQAGAQPPPPVGTGYWHGIIDPSRATDWSTAGVRGTVMSDSRSWPICQTISPSGVLPWKPRHVYALGDQISDTRGYIMEVVSAGTSMSDQPNWNTTPGGITTDGAVTWVMSPGISPLAQPRWWGRWGYLVGDVIIDANGNTQTAQTAGNSANPVQPAWTSLTQAGVGTVQDGGVQWQIKQITGTDVANIMAALVSCNGQSKVVQLSSGTFYLTNGLTWPQPVINMVLRGAGADQTTLAFVGDGTSSGRCGNAYICMNGTNANENRYASSAGFTNYYGGAAAWTGGYTKGSKLIVTSNWAGSVPTNANIGSPIYLDQRGNDINICTIDSSGTPNGTGLCAGKVGLSMSGTTVTVNLSLNHGYQVGDCVGVFSPTTANGLASASDNYSSLKNSDQTCPPGDLTRPGWFPITSVPTPSSFTYELPAQSGLAPAGTTGARVTEETGGLMNSNTPGALVTERGNYGRPCPPGNLGQPMPLAGVAGINCEDGFALTRQQMEAGLIAGVIDGGTGSCPAGSTCIELYDELIWPNWQFAKGPGVWWAGSNAGVGQYTSKTGVEDLTIDFTNDGLNPASSGEAGGIRFSHAVDSWVKGVRFINTNRNAVWCNFCQHVSIIDNYKANGKGVQSTAYGFEQESMASHNLIANNFCEDGPNCVMSNINTGNVIAYNFAVNAPFYTTFMRSMVHMGHAASNYNLAEGNNSPGITMDNIHGSGNANTVFRARIRGADYPRKINSNDAVLLQAGNRGTNFVGNVIGTEDPDAPVGSSATSSQNYYNVTNNQYANIFALGRIQSWWGIDVRVYRSMLRWGNYDAVTKTTRWCGDASSPNWTTDCMGVASATRAGTTPQPSSGGPGTACYVWFNRGPVGNSAWGFIKLTGQNTIADGAPIDIVIPGVGYSGLVNTAFMPTWNFPPTGLAATGCPGNFSVVATTAPQSDIPGAFTGWNANAVPANQILPPSFWTSSQPSFWQMKSPLATPPWPAIGPDVDATGNPLDASCTPNYPTVLSGPGSPSACDGIGHHTYQIPAQICYNSLQDDPAFPRATYGPITGVVGTGYQSVTGVGMVVKLSVANLLAARLVKNGSVMNMTEAVDISGVVPDSYNGRYVLADADRNSITLLRMTGDPGQFQSGVGSTVKTITPRKFNEHDCYANE